MAAFDLKETKSDFQTDACYKLQALLSSWVYGIPISVNSRKLVYLRVFSCAFYPYTSNIIFFTNITYCKNPKLLGLSRTLAQTCKAKISLKLTSLTLFLYIVMSVSSQVCTTLAKE